MIDTLPAVPGLEFTVTVYCVVGITGSPPPVLNTETLKFVTVMYCCPKEGTLNVNDVEDSVKFFADKMVELVFDGVVELSSFAIVTFPT